MRIAILTDVHANREALDATLHVVRNVAPDQIALLGDLVGYGPDPVYAVEKAAELLDRGAVCLLGNHDEAVVSNRFDMTSHARIAAEWTRQCLSPAHLEFLRYLPLAVRAGDRLYVHASAERPEKWSYIGDTEAAQRCFAATEVRDVFCGHTHVPAIYYKLGDKRPVVFLPRDNVAAPLSALRRHVVVVGSVGQPRDRNPAACFALLDTQRATVTMMRVAYDYDTTARKIEACGLPAWLGMRLKIGR
jgi:diadenosine tetraphosphatase ApaH/serine/threonine PP2A family protein phosphatase